MQNVYADLKVTRVKMYFSLWSAMYNNYSSTQFSNWANCLGHRMEKGDAKEYWTIYNTYIIHELVYLMLRDGLTRSD